VIVDFTFYCNVYQGKEADETSFPALCARAEDIVNAMVRWQDPATFSPFQMTLYKKAICAQIDYFAVNGTDSVTGGTDRGFTVGKVSVNGKGETAHGGAMSGSLSPLVIMYLEQSGLMNPSVPVVGGCVC
jgi:hypothetical protein